ncbi:MAG: hypothetical protein KDI03_16175, partial [Anaerolineae bacterium]|nr:hypothetical protein [Anaerolineae bacterium]
QIVAMHRIDPNAGIRCGLFMSCLLLITGKPDQYTPLCRHRFPTAGRILGLANAQPAFISQTVGQPIAPFCWTSGYRTDNRKALRMLLGAAPKGLLNSMPALAMFPICTTDKHLYNSFSNGIIDS